MRPARSTKPSADEGMEVDPRLREGASMAEVRAILRRWLRRRLGRGRFHLRH